MLISQEEAFYRIDLCLEVSGGIVFSWRTKAESDDTSVSVTGKEGRAMMGYFTANKTVYAIGPHGSTLVPVIL